MPIQFAIQQDEQSSSRSSLKCNLGFIELVLI